jgi:RNA polymerase sigma factor (sigma-70 family)
LSVFQAVFLRSEKYYFVFHSKLWQNLIYICNRYEGGNITASLRDAKGGEYMNPNDHESDKQRAFDCFCRKVLRNETRSHYSEMKRLRDKEVSISDLSEQELDRLSTTDEYFLSEQTFNVLDRDVIVKNESIAEALRNLPERSRDIILLYYFLELSDGEIGEKLNMIRSTVQYRRTTTLQELKKIMEEEKTNGRD